MDEIIVEVLIGCCDIDGHVISGNDFDWLNSFGHEWTIRKYEFELIY